MTDKLLTNDEQEISEGKTFITDGTLSFQNKTFTDGERSTIWGLKQVNMEILEAAGIPYCFNPENKRAVILFDGRRRISSVIAIFTGNPLPHIIRSKKSIRPFLDEGEIYPLQFGFGLELPRLTGEYDVSVEIAHIINEFKFKDLKELNRYLLKERPDLYKELVRHHNYYTKVINNFEGVDPIKELNKTLKNGFNQLSGVNKYAPADEFEENYGRPIW